MAAPLQRVCVDDLAGRLHHCASTGVGITIARLCVTFVTGFMFYDLQALVLHPALTRLASHLAGKHALRQNCSLCCSDSACAATQVLRCNVPTDPCQAATTAAGRHASCSEVMARGGCCSAKVALPQLEQRGGERAALLEGAQPRLAAGRLHVQSKFQGLRVHRAQVQLLRVTYHCHTTA